MSFVETMARADGDKVFADIQAALTLINTVADPDLRLSLLHEIDGVLTGITEPMIEAQDDNAA
jgi:hypothetical protein